MPNTLLTLSQITRESLRILHQKLNFIPNMNRQYDDSFAKSGAKIGDTLRIRLPNQYKYRTGRSITPQDTLEKQVSLPVTQQGGTEMTFTSAELALSLDDFSKRIIKPAMSVVAANIENTAMSMIASTPYAIGTPGTVPNALLTYLQGRQRLNDNLAPMDNRVALLSTSATPPIVDALKGLFNAQEVISKQYREGAMGRTAGFDWYENTLLPAHTMGNKVASVTVSGASQTGSNLLVGGVAASDTFTRGTVFTIAGVFEVHPETKAVSTRLQPFVVTANTTASGTTVTLPIYPAIVSSATAPDQNVSASPANSAALTFTGAANAVIQQSVLFQEDAFTFATADLPLPGGRDMAVREVLDGISMRLVRDYNINDDTFPCRVDVLFGFVAQRPELACRVWQ